MACAYSAPIDGLTGKVLPFPSGRGETGGFLAPRQVADRIGDGWFPSRATIYKRASFERAGGYLGDLRWLADWFMALVIAFRDGICHIPECLAHWTAMPTTYSAVGMRDPAANRAVLGAMLTRLTSADFADVAPLFRDTGALAVWGPDVVRAAATRPDCRDDVVLGLISGLSRPQYEALAGDDDPAVRSLASIFLGPLWRLGEGRRERLEARLAETKEVIAWMKTSKFWKVRNACVRLKQAFGARR